MENAPYLLWLDTETTSLDHRTATVLEVAWLVTDNDGDQLTPVRQRFTALHPDDSPIMPEDGHWEEYSQGDISQVVRDMHEKSGLTKEWGNAVNVAIRSASVIEQLILDDLRQAGAPQPPLADAPKSILTGDGVSHFERDQLLIHCPDLARGLHYRPRDISGALHVLTKSRYRSPVTKLLRINIGLAERLAANIELGSWPTFTAPTGELRSPVSWVQDEDIPHRAAPDIVRSWIAYRLMHHPEAVSLI